MTAFVELRQRTFKQTGGHTQQGDQPHPKQCTGATEGDGHGYSSDIASAHATGNTHRQRLETRDTLFRAPPLDMR